MMPTESSVKIEKNEEDEFEFHPGPFFSISEEMQMLIHSDQRIDLTCTLNIHALRVYYALAVGSSYTDDAHRVIRQDREE
jgi:hypothetical protein